MCGNSTTTQTQRTSRPKNVEDAMMQNLNIAKDIQGSDYEGFDSNRRYADLSGDQQGAFDQIRSFIGSNPAGAAGGYAGDIARQVGGASGQNIDVGRVVDEDGRLGKINDYMNPYLRQILDPAIRDMRESGSIARNELDTKAHMAGAFGDTGHGVLEGELRRGEQRNIGDMTGQVMAAGYGDAMGRRTDDMNRMFAGDTANANYVEQMLSRMLGAGGAAIGFEKGGNENVMAMLSSLLSSGDRQQGQEQLGRDAEYENYLREFEWPFRGLDAVNSVISGAPTTQTTTTEQPDNSGLGLLGGILGSIF